MTAILSREDLVKSPERARSHVVILGGRGEQGGVPASVGSSYAHSVECPR